MKQRISHSASGNEPKGQPAQNLMNTVDPDGARHTSLEALAMKGVTPNVMAEVTGHTTPLGMPLNSSAPLPGLSGTGASAQQLLFELEEQWAALKGSRLHRGYLSESRAFQRHAGTLANRPASAFTAHECAKIRDARLAELGKSAHQQCMANLRQVLRQLKGFPSQLVGVFRPHKKSPLG